MRCDPSLEPPAQHGRSHVRSSSVPLKSNLIRNDFNPRIAVTVDMIATGTDVKPIEVLIFLRDVRSELYFEQMKGRGVRSIEPTDLHAVTPDAEAKRFILIDAVGVTESKKSIAPPLDRDRAIAFDKLLDHVAAGDRREDTLSTLAARLAALDQRIDADTRTDLEAYERPDACRSCQRSH